MSKISALQKAIDLLDQAETALGEARRAFDASIEYSRLKSAQERRGFKKGIEYDILDSQFEVVGDAKTTVERLLSPGRSGARSGIEDGRAKSERGGGMKKFIEDLTVLLLASAITLLILWLLQIHGVIK